jgi:hypothetical protein
MDPRGVAPTRASVSVGCATRRGIMQKAKRPPGRYAGRPLVRLPAPAGRFRRDELMVQRYG